MTRDKGIDRATVKIFWREMLRNRREALLALLYPIGTICLFTLSPLFIGKILAGLAQAGDTTPYVRFFLVSGLVGIIANRIGFANLLALQARTMQQLQTLGLETLLRRSVGFHNNNIGGKLVSDAIDFPNSFSKLAGAIFIQVVPSCVILTGGTILVMRESWHLGLVVLLMAATTLVWGLSNSRGRIPLRHKRLKATKAVTAHLADSIVNVQTVKTFAREDEELAEHKKLNSKLGRLRIRDWRLAAKQGNNRIIVVTMLQLVFILTVIRLVQDNPELLGIGIFAFSFTITLTNRLFEIDSVVRTVEDGLLDASPMTEVILEEVEIKDAPHAQPLEVTQGAIALQHVTFRYQDNQAQDEVFTDLNLAIKPGEKIGLVGPSGGGKSTLTRLLLRFEDLAGGSIAIDNQNIAEVTQVSLRQNIAYVPQEPLLFHRTVRENIAYGKPNANDAAVRKAARLAHADEFIMSLPEKYETVVGERGVKLSGGQRQRIAIARAILKDAPLLILDEATSALDSESEVLIQDALWKLMKDRTALVIAHRLSTIQKMDRIIVMDDGRIVEEGSHQHLLRKKGVYAKLWAHQSGGFLED